MTANRHTLIEGTLVDVPGKHESFAEYVEYHGRSTWTLTLERLNRSGEEFTLRETTMERLSTKFLLEEVAERDAEWLESAAALAWKSGQRSPEGPGPRAQRLLVIAASVGADHCLRQLRKLHPMV